MQQKFHREISAQHIWSVPNLLRGRPQLKFLAQTVLQQLHRLDNSIKSEPVTRFILGLVDFFPKKATFKLSLMSNDENKFLPIFQILHIKNALFLLE